MSHSLLDQLKQYSTVVADTGNIEAVKQYLPTDATTNPSLILAAASMDKYQQLVNDTVTAHKGNKISSISDALLLCFAQQILAVIPGRVSVEIDASLSFDYHASVARAESIINRFVKAGVDKKRILIKIAATWEGIRAAKQLERDGIHTNLTLVFNFEQAIACADAGVKLISPFVGRIMDWYAAKENVSSYLASEDPGVTSVRKIYHYFKSCNYPTEIMAASFRNIQQILALSGCDLLTISPALLAELSQTEGSLEAKLINGHSTSKAEPIGEPEFRFLLNEDAMATEKLAEGIRAFVKDQQKLQAKINQLCKKS